MMSSKKGFTLVEILICILITFIVVGAIGLTLRMGLKLYEKAEANAAVTNGLRFTIDSYNRKVAPFLSQAESVDILENSNDLPANLPTSFDHYLYLEDGALCLWEKGARGPLAGSEYITSVDFKI
ncbi:PilW family protein, partial [Cloacibacillus evryensis]